MLATLATARSERLLGRGQQGPEARTTGYPLAFWIEAALVVAAIVAALVVVRGGPRDEEVRVVDEPHRDPAAYAEA